MASPSKNKSYNTALVWLIVIGVGVGLIWLNNRSSASTPSQRPAYTEPIYNPDIGPSTHGGYENPAPGDDGTADCPPGGDPVWVGSYDPKGLDGDGDGWGCE